MLTDLDREVTARIHSLSTPKLTKPSSSWPIENTPMCADYYVDWQLCYSKSILQLTANDLLNTHLSNQTTISKVNSP